ncbi:hypothetical protein PG985_013760 [Apiospora marii]|uniref:uncharacterized protein n=1 Tax=Apiospora marii TaxID=335849 RepID=UPI003131BB3D
MNAAHLNAGNPPFGIRVVNLTVVEFDFLEAARRFKATLPLDYVQTSWFDEIQMQCYNLQLGYRNSTVSLLFAQVEFLTCLYRGVLGGIAPESSWEKMMAEISRDRNGPADYMIKAGEMFDQAKMEKTDQDAINYIAKGGELSLAKFTFMTPMTPATSAKPSDGRMDLDKPNTWHQGLKLAHTSTFNLAEALEGMRKSDFDDHHWFETVLKGVCRYELDEDWPYYLKVPEKDCRNVSLLFLQVNFTFEVYRVVDDDCDDQENNPWLTVTRRMEIYELNSADDVLVDWQRLLTGALEKTAAVDLVKHLSQGLRMEDSGFITFGNRSKYIVPLENVFNQG